MAVTEYIGKRYVPKFADPEEWTSTAKYEALTIVTYQGNSYTSRQDVPVGIDITDSDYWVETGNYNAQIEAYRREVFAFDDRIKENAQDIGMLESELQIETQARTQADTALQQSIGDETQARTQADTALQQSIADETLARTQADTALQQSITTLNGKFPIGANDIASNAITTPKIASQAVTHDKIGEGAVTSINIGDGAIGLVDLNENVQSRIANNNVRYSNVVFIGDSYGRGVGGNENQGWPYYTAQALNIPSSRYVNVSNSGAGFIAKGHSSGLSNMTFSDQLDYALNNLPSGVSASQVDLVIIGGGYNDHAQSGINAAAYSTILKAYDLFPNAKVCFLPYCTGDRELTQEYNGAYHSMIIGASRAGAATCENSLYWLYPYELQTSYGDNIHPNNTGYQILGRYTASFVMGGLVSPFSETFGASGEGFEFAEGVASEGFRCGVNQGMAWMSGAFRRAGIGDLCTLPSYLRPIDTTYLLAFAYNDSDHHGIARIRVFSNGKMDFMGLESGNGGSGLNWTIWIPFITMPLGHEWQ